MANIFSISENTISIILKKFVHTIWYQDPPYIILLVLVGKHGMAVAWLLDMSQTSSGYQVMELWIVMLLIQTLSKQKIFYWFAPLTSTNVNICDSLKYKKICHNNRERRDRNADINVKASLLIMSLVVPRIIYILHILIFN